MSGSSLRGFSKVRRIWRTDTSNSFNSSWLKPNALIAKSQCSAGQMPYTRAAVPPRSSSRTSIVCAPIDCVKSASAAFQLWSGRPWPASRCRTSGGSGRTGRARAGPDPAGRRNAADRSACSARWGSARLPPDSQQGRDVPRRSITSVVSGCAAASAGTCESMPVRSIGRPNAAALGNSSSDAICTPRSFGWGATLSTGATIPAT